MEEKIPWQDPDYREPDLAPFDGIKQFAFWSVVGITISTLTLLLYNLLCLAQVGKVFMSWWWVGAPLAFWVGGCVITCIVLGSFALYSIISDIRHS